MENVYNFYSGYGDMPDYGNGPIQAKIHSGPEYIETDFPKLDRITTCTVQRVQPKQDNPLDQREEEQHVPKIGLQKQTGKTKQKRKTKSQLHSQRDVGKEQHNQKSGHGLDGMASLRKPHHYSDEHGASQHVDKNSPMEKRILNKVAHVHHGNVQPEEANHQEQQHLHHHHHHVTIQQDGHDPLKIKVPNETGSMQEGVTVFSWELLSVCLFMFVSVLLLWLNFVCRGGSKKARKTQ